MKLSDVEFVHAHRRNLEFLYNKELKSWQTTDGTAGLSDEDFHTAWNNKFPGKKIINGGMEDGPIKHKSNKFENIFAGREKGFGFLDLRFHKNGIKENGKKDAKSKEDEPINFETHLNGTFTQGHSPINRAKGGVRYLVIDFDKDIDWKITKEIWKISTELTCVMSLSGRWHIYYHFDKWTSVEVAKKARDRLIEKIRKLPFVEEKDVDEDHSLPGDVADQYWCFLPYSKEIQKCYTTWGETLSKEQYEYRYKFRKHPLIVAAIGQVEGRRHKALFNVAVYLKHKKLDTDLHELNKNFNPPLPEDELQHQLDSAEKDKYDQDHLNRNLPFWIDNLSGVKHFAEEKDPPDDMWKNSEQYEDYAFNNEPGTTDNEPGNTGQKELVGHDIADYRELNIPKPTFIVDALIKAPSINFFFGEKGKMKTEFNFGMSNHLVRGLDFLHFICSKPYPVLYIDGEMDPYDIIEREAVYLKELGPAPKDFLHIINWNFQKDQTIPDIKDKPGQELILKYLKKQEKLTGSKPLLILDNLRSLSNYKENESDEWRPIGVWLKNLRGLGFPSQVLDHTGKSAPGPRGTSSKTDWANVCCKVEPEKSNNKNLAKVKITFDKARGLRPAQSKEFCAEYDFQGLWTLALGSAAASDEDWCSKINETIVKEKAYSVKFLRKLDEDLKKGTLTTEAYETIIKNHRPVSTQKQIAEHLGLAAGKVNRLMKKDGPYDKWCETHTQNKGGDE